MYLGYDFNPELDDLKLKYPGDKGSDSQAIVWGLGLGGILDDVTVWGIWDNLEQSVSIYEIQYEIF